MDKKKIRQYEAKLMEQRNMLGDGRATEDYGCEATATSVRPEGLKLTQRTTLFTALMSATPLLIDEALDRITERTFAVHQLQRGDPGQAARRYPVDPHHTCQEALEQGLLAEKA
jgi:hypothetical protein